MGQNGALVAAAGADFQHLFMALQCQGLGHEGDDIGLGDGLPFADGQRKIAVCLTLQGILDKGIPGHRGHGVQDALVGDAPGNKLLPYHSGAGQLVITRH